MLEPQQRSKLDMRADSDFYSMPRFVHHLDTNFRAQLTQLYRERIPEGAAVLDLCSSWCAAGLKCAVGTLVWSLLRHHLAAALCTMCGLTIISPLSPLAPHGAAPQGVAPAQRPAVLASGWARHECC